MITEKEYLHWLCHVPGLKADKMRRLMEQAGSFKDIYYMKEQELKSCLFLTARERNAILELKKQLDLTREEYHRLKERRIEFTTVFDSGYPERLRKLPGMPLGLFVKGRMPDDSRPSAAVIGARGCSYYGKEEARYIARELARSGVQIVSGLAMGIDGAGHAGALEAGQETYGVLGCGIDICYPKENFWLFERMERQGGIITEFLPGTPPYSGNFPMRNRIISGLSDLVIVVEARKRSGSLITVGFALEQGKEVLAVPGRVTDPLSAGCNELIQTGAGVLLTPDDALDLLGMKSEKNGNIVKKHENGLVKNEKMVYSCLDLQPKHLEQIVTESGLPAGECMAVLLKLELEGFAVQTSNQYYVRKFK